MTSGRPGRGAGSGTAAALEAGVWVRFDRWDDGLWRYVHAARHSPLSAFSSRTDGFVQYEAADWPNGPIDFGGFAVHDEPCRLIRVTPEAVTS